MTTELGNKQLLQQLQIEPLQKAPVRLFRFVQLRVECVRDRRVNVPWFNFSQI